MSIQDKANELIHQSGLMKILQKYATPFIVGSYKTGIMTWNDLDIYLDIAESSNKYHEISSELIETLSPVRFDGFAETEKKQLFLGLETDVTGERWNIDIWWKDKTEIENSMAYAHDLIQRMERNPGLKKAVIKIKQDLIARRLYGFDKGKIHYHSNEIYDAVFEKGLLSTEQFLRAYKK